MVKKMDKKGQGLSMDFIIFAGIALIILVVLVVIYVGRASQFTVEGNDYVDFTDGYGELGNWCDVDPLHKDCARWTEWDLEPTGAKCLSKKEQEFRMYNESFCRAYCVDGNVTFTPNNKTITMQAYAMRDTDPEGNPSNCDIVCYGNEVSQTVCKVSEE